MNIEKIPLPIRIILAVALIAGLNSKPGSIRINNPNSTIQNKQDTSYYNYAQDSNYANSVTMTMNHTYNADYTQLIITTTYTNEGAGVALGITPYFQLFDFQGNHLQEASDEVIRTLAPGQSTSRTIIIDLNVDPLNIGRIYQEIRYSKLH